MKVERARSSRVHVVGPNLVRYLCDGREAFPAMLDAIDRAQREILLEMYWVGHDAVGVLFRDRLIARALQGVAVFVIYDGVGSLGLFRAFWRPLVQAGGRVVEYGPVAPWRRHFQLARLSFRDHRKILVVDGQVAYCGGLNLATQWLPREEGGEDWRDDVIEIRGPFCVELRTLVCESWHRLGHEEPRIEALPPVELSPRISVLANRISVRPDRLIRRTYLLAIRRARSSIDITSPYFLPGPLFLRALSDALKRGVRVRILVPGASDIWLVNLAMLGVIDKLIRDKFEVYAYGRSVLHSKTAVLDDRFVVIGSHNLDTFSWRFDLEVNVAVDDRGFAAEVLESFARDRAHATRLDLAWIRARPLRVRSLAWVAARLRTFL